MEVSLLESRIIRPAIFGLRTRSDAIELVFYSLPLTAFSQKKLSCCWHSGPLLEGVLPMALYCDEGMNEDQLMRNEMNGPSVYVQM